MKTKKKAKKYLMAEPRALEEIIKRKIRRITLKFWLSIIGIFLGVAVVVTLIIYLVALYVDTERGITIIAGLVTGLISGFSAGLYAYRKQEYKIAILEERVDAMEKRVSTMAKPS